MKNPASWFTEMMQRRAAREAAKRQAPPQLQIHPSSLGMIFGIADALGMHPNEILNRALGVGLNFADLIANTSVLSTGLQMARAKAAEAEVAAAQPKNGDPATEAPIQPTADVPAPEPLSDETAEQRVMRMRAIAKGLDPDAEKPS
jgi:hypothetical protein